MFTFHKIDNGIESGWYCLVDSFETMLRVLEFNFHRVVKTWGEIKTHRKYHCPSWEANAMTQLLELKARKENKNLLSMPESITYLSNLKNSAMELLID